MNKSDSFKRDRRRMIERVNVFIKADPNEDGGSNSDEDAAEPEQERTGGRSPQTKARHTGHLLLHPRSCLAWDNLYIQEKSILGPAQNFYIGLISKLEDLRKIFMETDRNPYTWLQVLYR